MSTLAAILLEAAIRQSLKEFAAWQERRARDAAWKPSKKDVEDYLASVEKDTVAKIEAEARKELGLVG